MSSAINKCATANDQVKTDICKVVKTTLKFDSPKYIAATNVLTDIEYTFQAMSGFYSNFLNCLNDQNETTNGVTTIRNLETLEYQLNVYVLTGIESKFTQAAEVLGEVFGERTKNVLSQIAINFASEFQIVKDSVRTLRDSFELAYEGGNAVSVDGINALLGDSTFFDLINAFKDIEITTKQCSSIVFNFVSVTTTLEKVTNSIATSQAAAAQMITKGDYNLDIAVQASKKLFASKTLSLQNDCEDAFSEFQIIGAQQFSGDEEVFGYRSIAENFVIEIKSSFDESSEQFQKFFTERLSETSKDISNLKDTVAGCSSQVTDYIAESVAENSGAFSKCLETNSQGATLLIEALGMNSSLCIAQQTNTSLTAQSLLSFISEDTVLNVKTQADRLCACSVKGDKKTEEKSKRCLKRVSDRKINID